MSVGNAGDPIGTSIGGGHDVANLKSLGANGDGVDIVSKSEEEQRRWFYSQCLNIKLSCPDKQKARKTLISDMYAQCREANIPPEQWVNWIKGKFGVPVGPAGSDALGNSIPPVVTGS